MAWRITLQRTHNTQDISFYDQQLKQWALLCILMMRAVVVMPRKVHINTDAYIFISLAGFLKSGVFTVFVTFDSSSQLYLMIPHKQQSHCSSL